MSGTQYDADHPLRLHNCGAAASRVNSPADYVKAELEARRLLMARECPGGAPPARPRGPQGRVDFQLDTVYNDPNTACTAFTDTRAIQAEVITQQGSARQVPLTPVALANPLINYPAAVTFPPMVLPAPPPPHSNANINRYTQTGNRAAMAGGNAQNAINQLQVLHNGPPPPLTWANKMTASVLHAAPVGTIPLPPATNAPVAGEVDMPAATLAAQASTAPAVFDNPGLAQHGQMRAIFVPVNVANPCGPWILKTMYPMNI